MYTVGEWWEASWELILLQLDDNTRTNIIQYNFIGVQDPECFTHLTSLNWLLPVSDVLKFMA